MAPKATGITQASAKKAPTKGSSTKKETTKSAENKDSEGGAKMAKAEAITKDLTSSANSKLMDIVNNGDEKALTSLPGVGAAKAAAIKKGRPFSSPAELINVEGVGPGILEGIVKHAKAGFPEPEKKPESEKNRNRPKRPLLRKRPAPPRKAPEPNTFSALVQQREPGAPCGVLRVLF
ncbi:MAG: helix-hairpin-helix domain-containing protein [Verrucomicrobiales bacterium]